MNEQHTNTNRVPWEDPFDRAKEIAIERLTRRLERHWGDYEFWTDEFRKCGDDDSYSFRVLALRRFSTASEELKMIKRLHASMIGPKYIAAAMAERQSIDNPVPPNSEDFPKTNS